MGLVVEHDDAPADIAADSVPGTDVSRDPDHAPPDEALEPAASLSTRSLWVATLFLAVLTMPLMPFVLPLGIELSFQSAQHTAIADGVDFGADAVFTYGPLGFLSFPQLYHPTTSLLALSAHVTVVVAAIAVTLRSIGRIVPPAAAIAGTYLVFVLGWGELLRLEWLAEAAACVIVLAALRRLVDAVDRPPEVATLHAMALWSGVATSVMGLVKLSSGLQVGSVSVTVLVLAGSLRPAPVAVVARTIALWAVAAATSLIAVWLATGQSVSALGGFISSSRELTSGYSGAMGLDSPGTGIEYLLAATLVLGIGAVAIDRFRRLGSIRAAVFCLPIGLYIFSAAKHGFVRHDRHAVVFFITVGLVALVLADRRNRMLVIGIGVLAFVASMVQGATPSFVTFDPVAHAGQSVEVVRLMVDPGRRSDEIQAARAGTREQYALSDETIARLAGTRVHADPHDTAILWAYPEFEWGAPPVFQTFGAYTAVLDDQNADYLSSDAAPDFILRQATAIDGRYPGSESPRYMVEMACTYEQVATDGDWFVLARRANRCGGVQELGRVEAPLGGFVPVPPATSCEGMMTFSVEGLDGAAQNLRAAIFKDAIYTIDFAGPGEVRGSASSYRLIPGTAAQPHLVPTPYQPAWIGPAHHVTGLRLGKAGYAAGLFTPSHAAVTFQCVAVG